MQIVPSVTESAPYTAVFALKTPAYDHSGLSHLVEHMVFRGSIDYPATHELFVINTLLPASINATTENGCTFYYVESEFEDVFMELINYLIAGIFEIHYSETELAIERDGVVCRELLMYEANPAYKNYSKAIRGSQSPQNVYNYGGFSDLLCANTIKRVIAYKGAHYLPSEVTLFIKAPSPLIDELEGKLDHHKPSSEQPLYQRLKPLSLAVDTPVENAVPVVSFFIHCVYYRSIKESEHQIQQALNPQEILIIESDISRDGLFAIRVITTEAETVKVRLLACVSELSIEKHVFVYKCTKQKGYIKDCIEQYLSSASQFEDPKSLISYLDNGELSYTNDIMTMTKKQLRYEPVLLPSDIAKRLKSSLSLDNISPLPKFFNSFFTQGHLDNFSRNDQHWLIKIEDCWLSNLTDKIIKPEFWMPRLRGDCYALGLGIHNNQLFIYGVKDIGVDTRHEFYKGYFSV